jgi:hypothetical protein
MPTATSERLLSAVGLAGAPARGAVAIGVIAAIHSTLLRIGGAGSAVDVDCGS